MFRAGSLRRRIAMLEASAQQSSQLSFACDLAAVRLALVSALPDP